MQTNAFPALVYLLAGGNKPSQKGAFWVHRCTLPNRCPAGHHDCHCQRRPLGFSHVLHVLTSFGDKETIRPPALPHG